MQRSNAVVVTRFERPSVSGWRVTVSAAVVGPVLSGHLADRTSFGPALRLALLVQSAAVVLPALGMGTVGLIVSSLVVGAFTPGIVPLVLGRVHELLPHDVVAQQASWSTATTGFALMQATAAYGLTFVFTQTGGDYQLLFILGAGILITAPGIDLAVSVFPSRRRAAVRCAAARPNTMRSISEFGANQEGE